MEVNEAQVWITSRAPERRGSEHTEGERGDTGETRMRRRKGNTRHSPTAGLPPQQPSHLSIFPFFTAILRLIVDPFGEEVGDEEAGQIKGWGKGC